MFMDVITLVICILLLGLSIGVALAYSKGWRAGQEAINICDQTNSRAPLRASAVYLSSIRQMLENTNY